MISSSSQVEYPVFWTVEEFCDAFLKLIDHMELDKVSVVTLLVRCDIISGESMFCEL